MGVLRVKENSTPLNIYFLNGDESFSDVEFGYIYKTSLGQNYYFLVLVDFGAFVEKMILPVSEEELESLKSEAPLKNNFYTIKKVNGVFVLEPDMFGFMTEAAHNPNLTLKVKESPKVEGKVLYTSYHSRVGHLKKDDMVSVNISYGAPRWIQHDLDEQSLAPPVSIRKEYDIPKYVAGFNKMLEGLDANKIVEELFFKAGGKTPILCCYEKPADFCHRHLVADWIEANTDYKVVELGFELYDRKDGKIDIH